MQKTAQIKLQPTSEQSMLLKATTEEYIRAVNEMVDAMYMFDSTGKCSSRTVFADLPSAVKNQCCRDARSVFSTYRKRCKEAEYRKRKKPNLHPRDVTLPTLKKPVAIWNNQNYTVADSYVAFPVWVESHSVKISVKAIVPTEILDILNSSKLGSLRIVQKGRKWMAQVAYEVAEKEPKATGHTMGIDLGLKCPAVCYTDAGKVAFVGNGRKNKVIRRKFYARRKKLGKAKKVKAIIKSNNKEQRIMQDIDHKLSRQIVNYAIQNNIQVIKMEELANIRKKINKKAKKTSTSRKNINEDRKKIGKRLKNNRNIASWSFYRLANYIEYKAKLAGIETIRINPAYTSQTCPVCGKKNHANDRNYLCACGYHKHRDLVGAINICSAS